MLKTRQLRTRVLLVAAAPLIALLTVAGFGVAGRVQDARGASSVQRLTRIATSVNALTDHLQRERAMASGTVTMAADLTNQLRYERGFTDLAVADFRATVRATRSSGVDGNLQTAIDAAFREVATLPAVRKQPAAQAPAAYGEVLDSLLAVDTALAGQDPNAPVSQALRAQAALARLKEHASKQTALLYASFSQDHLNPTTYAAVAYTVAAQDAARADLQTVADPTRFAQVRAHETDLYGTLAAGMRDAALAKPAGAPLGIDPVLWLVDMTQVTRGYHDVEADFAADVARAAADTHRDATNQAILFGLAAVVAAALALAGAAASARSITDPVVRMTGAARRATDELPETVARIARDERDDDAPEVARIEVAGRDELAELARAFNAANEVALRVAGEQAQLRASIGAMFKNLARRIQSLLDRQLAAIEALEQHEQEPSVLQDLFLLDHLATRMRRNAESLLVLAGVETARRREGPIPLSEVVRAAMSEVEDFRRIDLSAGDERAVKSTVGPALAHLLAELLENATVCSPPHTRVRVTSRPVAQGSVVEIVDEGIGMTDQQLAEVNHRLAEAAPLEPGSYEQLGLHVVSRIASRYDIDVRLERSAFGGIAAVVQVPTSALAEPLRHTPLDHDPMDEFDELPLPPTAAPVVELPSEPPVAEVEAAPEPAHLTFEPEPAAEISSPFDWILEATAVVDDAERAAEAEPADQTTIAEPEPEPAEAAVAPAMDDEGDPWTIEGLWPADGPDPVIEPEVVVEPSLLLPPDDPPPAPEPATAEPDVDYEPVPTVDPQPLIFRRRRKATAPTAVSDTAPVASVDPEPVAVAEHPLASAVAAAAAAAAEELAPKPFEAAPEPEAAGPAPAPQRTATGLVKRVPKQSMHRELFAVDDATAAKVRGEVRTPDQVGSMLTAFHQGVGRARTQDEEPTKKERGR